MSQMTENTDWLNDMIGGGISMKYKILIIGEDYSDINDIYEQFGRMYEVLISSPIAADISAHIQYFKPDLVMLSLDGVHDYVVDEYKNAKSAFNNVQKIMFAVAGSRDDLMWFEQQWPGLADLTIDTARDMVDIQVDIEVKLKKYYKDRMSSAPAPKVSVNSSAPARSDTNPQNNAGSKKTILVIDDSPIMLKVIREQLREFYDVVIVTSGQLALKYLSENMVDMILLDYAMPEMSGLDVLKQLKADGRTKSIPVVFLTGVSERAKIAQALALGPQGYLLKPIDRDKLFAIIHKCIG